VDADGLMDAQDAPTAPERSYGNRRGRVTAHRAVTVRDDHVANNASRSHVSEETAAFCVPPDDGGCLKLCYKLLAVADTQTRADGDSRRPASPILNGTTDTSWFRRASVLMGTGTSSSEEATASDVRETVQE
jgi:hypothetical protein